MKEPCPSNYALDAFRLGLDDAVSAHVEACARCTAWLGEQDRLEARVAGLWVAAAPKRPWLSRRVRRYLLGLGLPVAVAAAVLLLLPLPEPPPTEIAKGWSVQIGRWNGDAVAWLRTGDSLRPNDSLRFFVPGSDADDRFVLIGSVDGSQRLFPLYPDHATGCSVAVPPVGQPLDGSIVIDDAPGPERIVVVISHRPLCWPAVSDAVRRFALGERLLAELAKDGVHAILLTFAKQLGTDH